MSETSKCKGQNDCFISGNCIGKDCNRERKHPQFSFVVGIQRISSISQIITTDSETQKYTSEEMPARMMLEAVVSLREVLLFNVLLCLHA